MNVGGDAPPSSLFGPEKFMAVGKVDDVAIAGAGKGPAKGGRLTSLHTHLGRRVDSARLRRGGDLPRRR